MENENKSSSNCSCSGGKCQSTKFIIGWLCGVAVSFLLAFAFITLFAGSLLDDGTKGGSAKVPSNNAPAAENAPSAAVGVGGDIDSLTDIATSIDIDEKSFQKCLEDGTFKDEVQRDSDTGLKAGITGTPGNIIVSKYGTEVASGALPFENFKTIIDAHIAGTVAQTEEIELDPITKDDWIRGDVNAPISIIEYSDVDCPFCKRHHPTLTQVLEEYDGQVNWVYRHYPLDQLHPSARAKAEASECAGDVAGAEKFWEYLDILYL